MSKQVRVKLLRSHFTGRKLLDRGDEVEWDMDKLTDEMIVIEESIPFDPKKEECRLALISYIFGELLLCKWNEHFKDFLGWHYNEEKDNYSYVHWDDTGSSIRYCDVSEAERDIYKLLKVAIQSIQVISETDLGYKFEREKDSIECPRLENDYAILKEGDNGENIHFRSYRVKIYKKSVMPSVKMNYAVKTVEEAVSKECVDRVSEILFEAQEKGLMTAVSPLDERKLSEKELNPYIVVRIRACWAQHSKTGARIGNNWHKNHPPEAEWPTYETPLRFEE